ncbi:hypothetical protein NECAME_07612 [Necator americanus]|uniref:Uncharacterized protein n=1 Tax=Necator americanus TaxID=51031 RepID=W2TLN9_NECAM|nr:hypothetical protein NECAME_07612 [Necator americanus]ETN83020.1 hypothetical protein NECAME_07612 [Necator americanus]
MKIIVQVYVMFFSLPYVKSYAATSPGTSIPTTGTTTTASALTACMTCTVSQISFDKANGAPNSIDSSFRVEAPDPATGCLLLTSICAAQQGFFAFMEFNINEGGPKENLDVVQVPEFANQSAIFFMSIIEMFCYAMPIFHMHIIRM